MLNRKLSARIACILLVVHGIFEIAGLLLVNSMPLTLISFGGLNGPGLERNASAIAMYGVLWGIARLVAAGGIWSLRKWALILGILMSIMTMIAAITIVPAGVTDTLFSVPVLVFLLYAWFGNDVREIMGG